MLTIAIWAEHCVLAGRLVPSDRFENNPESDDFVVYQGELEELEEICQAMFDKPNKSQYDLRTARTLKQELRYRATF